MLRLLLGPLLLASTCAYAQTIVEETSFGYGPPRAVGANQIHGWNMLGDGHDLQLLSDKVILTPPYPGNRRGALWAQHTTALEEWTADFEFRASGGERAGGNLQLWYVRDGQHTVSTSSIYTIGQFDGLAIVIDSHAGGMGSIRGFLNDGTTNYQSRHPAVDALAFGHCEYGYRNLGRPSRLQLKHGRNSFELHVDDRLCFKTDKVSLPPNYSFGISGATSENPDSFEVFKFVVTSGTTAQSSQAQQSQQEHPKYQEHQKPLTVTISAADSLETPKDVPASSISGSEAQFADLHNRLQGLNSIINSLFHEFTDLKIAQSTRHDELMRATSNNQLLTNLDRRLQSLEATISGMKTDIELTDHRGQYSRLNEKLTQTHAGITAHLTSSLGQVLTGSSPRTGFLLIVVIVLQVGFGLSYFVYKRKRANSPKKFL